jgi:hypothetical protein
VALTCLQDHVALILRSRRYPDEKDAAKAYDKAAVYLHGENAQTNFGIAAAGEDDTPLSKYIIPLKEPTPGPPSGQSPREEEQQHEQAGRKRRLCNAMVTTSDSESWHPSEACLFSQRLRQPLTPGGTNRKAHCQSKPQLSARDSDADAEYRAAAAHDQPAGQLSRPVALAVDDDDAFDLMLSEMFGGSDLRSPGSAAKPHLVCREHVQGGEAAQRHLSHVEMALTQGRQDNSRHVQAPRQQQPSHQYHNQQQPREALPCLPVGLTSPRLGLPIHEQLQPWEILSAHVPGCWQGQVQQWEEQLQPEQVQRLQGPWEGPGQGPLSAYHR